MVALIMVRKADAVAEAAVMISEAEKVDAIKKADAAADVVMVAAPVEANAARAPLAAKAAANQVDAISADHAHRAQPELHFLCRNQRLRRTRQLLPRQRTHLPAKLRVNFAVTHSSRARDEILGK